MTTSELLLQCWRVDAFAVVGCFLATIIHVRRRGRPVARLIPYGIALAPFALAMLSPIGVPVELRHLLLVLALPPLALLGLYKEGRRPWSSTTAAAPQSPATGRRKSRKDFPDEAGDEACIAEAQ
jgi:hypothetical protein